PKQIKNNDKHTSYMIDGGILSNFPLWIFRKSNNDLRPVLGVSLSEDLEHADALPIKNALDMLHALFMTMQRAHDTTYISKSKEKQASLIDLGVEHTNAFLKNWP